MCHPIISLMSHPQEGGERDSKADRNREMKKKKSAQRREGRERDGVGGMEDRDTSLGTFSSSPLHPLFPTPLSLIGLKL